MLPLVIRRGDLSTDVVQNATLPNNPASTGHHDLLIRRIEDASDLIALQGCSTSLISSLNT